MDFELTDEQHAFVQAARDYAQGELAPHAARWDAEGIFPREAILRGGKLGFCAIYASDEIGGLNLPRLDATLVFEEMAAVDPSTTAYFTIHNMVTWMVGQWAQPAVRQSWGPLLASGEKLGSYCLTEPGAGSDAASLTTRAERQGADYVLNGAKAFISGGGDTDLLLVMARTGGEGAGGISAFAVPADSPGIGYGRKEEKMGWNSVNPRDRSLSKMCGCQGRIGWGKKAMDSRSLCAVWTVVASTLRFVRLAQRRAHWMRRGAIWTNVSSSAIN